MDIRLVIEIASLVVNMGLFSILMRFFLQWNRIKERIDILWLTYCRDHNIPFRPIDKYFEGDK